MIKRFGFPSNSRDADVVDDLPTSIDFQAQKDGVVIFGIVVIFLFGIISQCMNKTFTSQKVSR